jgi:hypothetical protein
VADLPLPFDVLEDNRQSRIVLPTAQPAVVATIVSGTRSLLTSASYLSLMPLCSTLAIE